MTTREKTKRKKEKDTWPKPWRSLPQASRAKSRCEWTLSRLQMASIQGMDLGGFYMWKLAAVRVWYRYDIVISYRVYMKGHFMSTGVIVTPYWIGYRRLRMRYPFHTLGRVISCWSERPYRVFFYMTSEWVIVPEWKCRFASCFFVKIPSLSDGRRVTLLENYCFVKFHVILTSGP